MCMRGITRSADKNQRRVTGFDRALLYFQTVGDSNLDSGEVTLLASQRFTRLWME